MSVLGILFDNDGTLVDTHDLILSSMRHTTQTVLGCALPDEQLMAKVGIPLSDQMMDFASSIEQRDELLRVYREHNHAHHDAAVKLFPGVLKGLQDLAAEGVAMGVVTSKKAPLATRGLQITNAWTYLSCLVGPDDCEKAKPHPDPVLKGVQLLGLEPSTCAYVGDSPFDIQAGNAAGLTTIAVTWGMFSSESLEQENPDYIFSTFADLVDWALS